jgi:hypothetical protein
MSAAARALDFDELPADLTTSAGPIETLVPPLSPLERRYLLGLATPDEVEQVLQSFDERAKASPDGVFWCGFDDDDS